MRPRHEQPSLLRRGPPAGGLVSPRDRAPPVRARRGARSAPRRPGWFGSGVAFAFRCFAGFSLLRVLLMLTMQTAEEKIEPLRRLAFVYPATGLAFSAGCMMVFIALLPLLLQVVFAARPLPPGPLRERMEAICRSSGFRCRELLIFPTGGAKMSNAFIVGLAAP